MSEERANGPARKPLLPALLRLAISVFLLWFLLSRVETGALRQALERIPLATLAGAFLLFSLAVALNGLRWRLFLAEAGVELSLAQTLRIHFSSFPFTVLLPLGRLGSDVARLTILSRAGSALPEVTAATFLWRLTGLAALVLAGAATAGAGLAGAIAAPPALLWTTLALALLLLALMALLVAGVLHRPLQALAGALARLTGRQNLPDKAARLATGLAALRRETGRAALVRGFVYSLLLLAPTIGAWILVGSAWQPALGAERFLLIVPLVGVTQLVPVAAGGIGLREGAALFLFTLAGAAREDALGTALVFSAFNLLLALAGGAVLLFRRKPT